jgi:membrane protein implicated in regulation of membrane protease activity
MRGFNLFLPFLGMAGGACFFLAAGVEIFGFPTKLAYAIAVPMTIFTSWLVWSQLGKILAQIEEGGSAALDLDSFR